jgi:hypothetical protein
MEYITFGDAQQYLELGELCANSLRTDSLLTSLMTCSAGIRPVGMQLYSAIPYLITNDPLLINYYYLFFNLISFYFVFAILGSLFRTNTLHSNSPLTHFLQFSICAICLLPFIPIIMADLISLAFYCAGIYFLYKGVHYFIDNSPITKQNYGILFLSGFFFAASILFKQTFFIYCILTFIAFIIIYRKNLFSAVLLTTNCKAALSLTAGFSIVLIQFILVYAHTGIFWLYDPAGIASFLPLNHQPYLEMIAHSFPSKTAIMITLTSKINAFWFYLARFYLGMSKIYLPVYHGFSPISSSQFALTISKEIALLSFFMAYSLITFMIFKISSKITKTLILSSFFIAIFTAMTMHTENRYYLIPRMIFLFSLFPASIYLKLFAQNFRTSGFKPFFSSKGVLNDHA